MDVDSIPAGTQFADQIRRAVSGCHVVIVLIGRRWLDAGATGRRRLDDPDDFVRLEIATALREEIPVIPVLIQGTLPPESDKLPGELAALASIQAIEITDSRWAYDTARLVQTVVELAKKRAGNPTRSITRIQRAALWTIGTLLVVIAGIFGGYRIIANGNQSNLLPNPSSQQVQDSPKNQASPITGPVFAVSYVKRIQTRLQELKLYKGEINGFFNDETRQAIMEFQRRNNMPADGIIGPQTERLLFPN